MSAPLVLAVFAMLTASVSRRHLLTARWVERSPSWGIWAWQAASLAVALATLLIGVTLALPVLPVRSSLMEVLQTAHLDATEHYRTPAGNGLAIIALIASVLLAGRVLTVFGASLRSAVRLRSQHQAALALVGSVQVGGFTVVEHTLPLVYSLPGRRRTVVVTRAALNALSDQELQSVLAHERTHLRLRHDLALAFAEALARAFSVVPFFQIAHRQVSLLVEMQADDAARDSTSRHAMARALQALQPTGAPTAGSARVRRLADTVKPAQIHHRLAIGTTTIVLLATPVTLALLPAVEASTHACCHEALPQAPRR